VAPRLMRARTATSNFFISEFLKGLKIIESFRFRVSRLAFHVPSFESPREIRSLFVFDYKLKNAKR